MAKKSKKRGGKGQLIETALEPTAKEFRKASKGAGVSLGKSMLIITRSVEVLVAPLEILVWGFDKIKERFVPELEKKMEGVPIERRITPDLMVAGPAFEALKFTGHQADLRDLYANLLATAMDEETARNAHPAFVEIIKQISPDEARILRVMSSDPAIPMIDIHRMLPGGSNYTIVSKNLSHLGLLAGCEHQHLVPSYIDNLCRLEVCTSPTGAQLADPDIYDALENDLKVKAIVGAVESEEGVKVEFLRRYLDVTTFGNQFIQACVIAKNVDE